MKYLLEKFTLDELDRYSMVELPDYIKLGLEDLQKELDYVENSLTEMEEEIDDLKDEVHDLEEDLRVTEEERRDLESQLKRKKLTLLEGGINE